MLSRPTLDRVAAYRAHVDDAMRPLLERAQASRGALAALIELGLNHEQQHQELILTDIKHLLSRNPLKPAYYAPPRDTVDAQACKLDWITFPEGVRRIGYEGNGFAFDNEGPPHRVLMDAFELASRPVTNGEFLAFIDDGGYARADLWLSDGWNTVCEQGWKAPLYWEWRDEAWHTFTLAGMQPVAAAEPVTHVSYYEADAYARWADARLPTEAEWETAARETAIAGNFLEMQRYHPTAAAGDAGALRQLFGDVWEWTQSAYAAYPGFRPAAGAIGEYNGKFMCNQFVLRGGSCATPASHIRASYRNFFPPAARWQFSGVRLARDVRR
jgi:ergothioneine biosynthesis protein EgtB